MNATLLCIVGADRDDKIAVRGRDIKISGSTDLHRLIGEPYHRLHVAPQLLRQHRRPELGGYSCLLNLITEPEHNPRVLEILRKLLRGVPGKVINRPEAVLTTTRDQVARRLAGIQGLLAPKVVRLRTTKPAIVRETIGRAGLAIPIILREAGTHTGRIIGRFENGDDVQAALADGGDHIATEFIDFRSSDGLYRKYRVFFFGRRMVFRHMLVSDDWSVHARDRSRFMADRPELIEQEKAMFASPEGAFPPEIREALFAVRERMPLDFFGMDFGVGPDGRVVLFEANATMNFFSPLPGPQFAYLRACIAPAQSAFRELLGLEPAQATPRPDFVLSQ